MDADPRYLSIALTGIGVALIVAGPATLLVPDRAASAFGIGAEDPHARAYLLASAVRDAALGTCLLAAATVRSRRRLLAWLLVAFALVAAGDATIVAAYVGWRARSSLAVHVGSLFVLVLLASHLWRMDHD